MSEKFSWTAGLGRWCGVALQLHFLFILFALAVLCVQWLNPGSPPVVFGTGLATIAIVFVLAVFHELAHAWAAVNLGGGIRNLVITPWGGPSDLILPPQPRAQLVVQCAGPFFHLLLFGIGAILLVSTGHNTIGQLTNPLQPLAVGKDLDISVIQIATWVNFQMLWINLIPAAPFDGCRIVRSAVRSWNPHVSELRLETAVLGIGLACGLVMFVFAWVLRDYNTGPVQPTWFVLACAGVTLIFVSRNEFHQWFAEQQNDFSMLDELLNYESMEDEFMDSVSDYEDDEDSLADWMVDQMPGSELAERSVAIEEERRVDVILEKLHSQGIEALTDDERMFLDRISQQYRRRRETNP